jgi:uncharacterized membrane protein YbhN (UPF0104 family)
LNHAGYAAIKNTASMLNYSIKLSITAALLFLIFINVDLEKAYASASLLSLGTILLALTLQIASNSIAAFRWFLIMQRIGSAKNFLFFLQSYFKGTFFNQGLPTSIGGDAIRILDCSRNSHSKSDGFYGVFIDRFVGLAGLLILNIAALLFNRNVLPHRIFIVLLAILALLFCGLIVLLFVYRLRLFRISKWFGFIGQLSERYYQVYATPFSFFVQIGLSVIIHLLAMSAFYVLGVGVGLDYPLHVYLVLVPPVVLLTILPVSLAGWGIREGAMIGFFLLVGADRSKVLTFSLLYGLLALTSSLPGLFVYLAQKNRL